MLRLLLFFIVASPLFASAQTKATHLPKDSTKAEEKFEPIQLWFVMLKKGTNRTQDSITAEKIQAGHMNNIKKMAKAGKLLTAGPFMEDADWRGILVLKCESKEEGESLVKQDPAVVAGRLSYEIHPWMTGKNCLYK